MVLLKNHPKLGKVLTALAAVCVIGLVLAADLLHWDTCLALQGHWTQRFSDLPGTRLELRVRGSRMEYHLISERFPEMNELLHTYTFTPTDQTTLCIAYDETHTVETAFTLQKGVLTFSPAVTRESESETWYKK